MRKRHEEGFAYRDKYGIVHIVQSETTAQEYGGINYVFVEFPNEVGYPIVDGEEVFDYGDEIYIGENRHEDAVPVPLDDPRLAEYIEKVRNKL